MPFSPDPPVRFHNTLTRAAEAFEPLEPGRVTLYCCGPTVYDFAHIGNFRSFLFADVLRRFLELLGYGVHQVMNLTDVGHMTEDDLADGGGQDKMAAAGQRLLEAKKEGVAHARAIDDPTDPYAVADFYIDAFLTDARRLGMRVADDPDTHRPRATAFVPQMVHMIKTLVDRGHAYVGGDGAVYYSVESFPAYGRLSGNDIDDLRGGAGGRVTAAETAAKQHPADFLLWKPDATHLMTWDAPWGRGYPGWHIECSAMATATLGRDRIDLHTGGEDNIFPHHECEIAQSCGASGQDRFANVWLHARHLMVEGQKMSKSKGNFHTVRDVLEGGFTGRPVDAAVLRLELIRGHYRNRTDFTRKGLADTASAVQKLRGLTDRLADRAGDTLPPPAPDRAPDFTHPMLAEAVRMLADDLNVAGVLGAVFEHVNALDAEALAPEDAATELAALRAIDQVLGVLEPEPSLTGEASLDADALCTAIDTARAAKDFAEADRLRAELTAAGYTVQTGPAGTTATAPLA